MSTAEQSNTLILVHQALVLLAPNSSPHLSLEDNWSAEDEAAFDERLQNKGSRKILTAKKRSDIKYWLTNPDALIPKENKAYASNTKYEAKRDYHLQDGQVYRNEFHDSRSGETFPTRYAVCFSDAFEILTTVHEKLMHPGKCIAFFLSF